MNERMWEKNFVCLEIEKFIRKCELSDIRFTFSFWFAHVHCPHPCRPYPKQPEKRCEEKSVTRLSIFFTEFDVFALHTHSQQLAVWLYDVQKNVYFRSACAEQIAFHSILISHLCRALYAKSHKKNSVTSTDLDNIFRAISNYAIN